MARQARKVLFEVRALDGRMLRVDFDQYGYAASELYTIQSGGRKGEQDWRTLPASHYGTVNGVVGRLFREQLQALDGLQAAQVVTVMDAWGKRLEAACQAIGNPRLESVTQG